MVVNVEEQGEEILKEFGIDMCMLWYLKWIMNKVIKYSIGNFVQSYVAAWMGGELGENGYMYIYVCDFTVLFWDNCRFTHSCEK